MSIDIYGSVVNTKTKGVSPVIPFDMQPYQSHSFMNLANGNCYDLLDALGIDSDMEFPFMIPVDEVVQGMLKANSCSDGTPAMDAWRHYKERFIGLVMVAMSKGATHISFV